jgi:hypothetical protein
MSKSETLLVSLNIHVWAKRNRNDSVTIKIASNNPKFISTIEEVPGKRMHKHLFAKLRTILTKNGKWPV